MSEFQYYEFRKISGTLSDKAMDELSGLSSRAQVSRTSAVFTYDFGDFRGDPIKVLVKHFDILFYTANWGSRRLAFRFPFSAVGHGAVAKYASREMISVKRMESHLLVDADLQDENLHDSCEGEGVLDHLAGLYDDLLAEDYRALFLLWLQGTALENEGGRNARLPAIPSGLGQIEERHRVLIEVFGVNPDLLATAEPYSGLMRQTADADLARALATVPAKEQTRFLERIVLGEAPSTVIAELRRLLLAHARADEPVAVAAPKAPPSVRLLFAQADQLQAERKRAKQQRAAAKERQRLELIERDEVRLWRRVNELIAAKSIKAYDEAIGILKDLRDLALHKQRREEFVRKIEDIRAKHTRLPGLLYRLAEANLL